MMGGAPLFNLNLLTMIGGIGHVIWGVIMGYLVPYFTTSGYLK